MCVDTVSVLWSRISGLSRSPSSCWPAFEPDVEPAPGERHHSREATPPAPYSLWLLLQLCSIYTVTSSSRRPIRVDYNPPVFGEGDSASSSVLHYGLWCIGPALCGSEVSSVCSDWSWISCCPLTEPASAPALPFLLSSSAEEIHDEEFPADSCRPLNFRIWIRFFISRSLSREIWWGGKIKQQKKHQSQRAIASSATGAE